VSLRVLASGVDRLEVSVRGSLRNEVLLELEAAKAEAQRTREPEPYLFAGSERVFLVQAGGRRAYPYVLVSADIVLMVRPNGELPPVRADMLSAYLHEVGAEVACAEVGELARGALFVVPPELVVSRVDVYADVQGWELGLRDAERFVSRARKRTTHTVGQRFTGYVFGEGGPMLARLYDKTAEIGRRGQAWLPERWGEREDEGPVWRLEYQYRRRVLAEFGAGHPADVLSKLGDLWRHGTGEWLTLRVPTGQAERWRWPLDESWAEVQRVEVGPGQGAKRERAAETSRERVVRFLQGNLTTWGALGAEDEIGEVWRSARPAVVRYLAEQGRTFRDEVRHKRRGCCPGRERRRHEVEHPYHGAVRPSAVTTAEVAASARGRARQRPGGPRVVNLPSWAVRRRTPRGLTRPSESHLWVGRMRWSGAGVVWCYPAMAGEGAVRAWERERWRASVKTVTQTAVRPWGAQPRSSGQSTFGRPRRSGEAVGWAGGSAPALERET